MNRRFNTADRSLHGDAGMDGEVAGGVSFPPGVPDSLADAEAIRVNDWRAYKELVQLEDHWSLKAWVPGYAAYYWYLTFAEEELVALAARCQDRLDTTDLDLIPPDGLHVTLVKVGAADDITDPELPQFVAAAEQRLAGLASFSVEVGPLAGSRSAIRLSVTPWERLVDLHERLRMSVISVRPTPAPKPTSRFRPHLGIAYNNQRRPAAPVIEMVAALRDIGPVSVSVDRVKLVRLWRTDHQYRWEECAAIALGT
ncbi:2'-5' RNA ligase family protein [Nocardia puris]|uniref:2'-5' RNA ligase family protein n=1 Tax=Nocardia puris TaxID=208602 RepID=UPI002E22A01D